MSTAAGSTPTGRDPRSPRPPTRPPATPPDATGRDESTGHATMGEGAGAGAVRDPREVVARQQEQFGGIKPGSAFFGWLTATGTAVLLAAVVSAAGVALGLATNTTIDRATSTASADTTTPGITGSALPTVTSVIPCLRGRYRALALRYGEFGCCHRNEPWGALHGLMRVRGFTQDDGHIFCTEDQIPGECVAYTALLQKVYRDFGNRSDRKRARLKYVIYDWGMPAFKAKVEEYLGRPLDEPRPNPVVNVEDHLGWSEQGDGKLSLGIPGEDGRIKKEGGSRVGSGPRA